VRPVGEEQADPAEEHRDTADRERQRGEQPMAVAEILDRADDRRLVPLADGADDDGKPVCPVAGRHVSLRPPPRKTSRSRSPRNPHQAMMWGTALF
jgi:hypothetical protein